MVYTFNKEKYRTLVKRIFDIFISTIFIVLLFPLIILISIIIRINYGKPIFFKQERPGLNGNIFVMYKFRTMNQKKDKYGKLLSDRDRITVFGNILRSSSLDELPELYNVLIGDMSIVGPRPLLIEYLPLYTKKQNRRHEAKPGITGMAQINGRNTISWEKKFEYDLWYIDNWSIWLDIKILAKTFFCVLIRKNINHNINETMPLFFGNEKDNVDEK